MEDKFDEFALYLEDTFGVVYDEEEQMVQCPECGDWILREDWEPDDYSFTDKAGNLKYVCPICESQLG